MSATVPHELMVLVERVVRPLPIPLSRQKRLRTEFLEHLHAIYSEELARDSDEAAATVRTKARFGDPARLTIDLLSTIRWWEPLQAWWQRAFVQRHDESLWKYVARIVMGSLPLLLLPISLRIVALIYRGYWNFYRVDLAEIPGAEFPYEFRLVAGYLICVTVWLGVFLFFSLQLGSEWLRPVPRWGRILWVAIASAVITPIFLEVLAATTGSLWSEYPVHRQAAWSAGALLVFLGHQFGVRHFRETNYRREWAALVLETA